MAGSTESTEPVTMVMAMALMMAKFLSSVVWEKMSTRKPSSVVPLAVITALPTWEVVPSRHSLIPRPDS